MIIAWILILIIVIFIIRDIDITGERVSVLGFSTKYFYMSNGESKKMYEQMRKDGIPDESLKEFIMMEDRFLNLERLSVCTQTSRIIEAFGLSKQIKDGFLGYDFSYHAKHLKQISEPPKLINRSIVCS
jgi:hypothetical protein|tara:strand:+ start:11052 stop:11438 length:387 start_codon:yes stop_codon:yes gene_type:complete